MTTSGILVVHKPCGPTSHDIVAQARRLYRCRHVGHAGTLDPLATGVLILLFGEATKLSHYLTGDDKAYLASVEFGRTTDTLDLDGETRQCESLPTGWLSGVVKSPRWQALLEQERARREQIPPAFSALKIGGQRAHRLSRQGKTPDLGPRPVEVRGLELEGVTGQTAVLRLSVSKGYYVRALARDLGAGLGVPALLSGLTRVASGDFTLEEAVQWPADPPPPILPLTTVLARVFPVITLTPTGASRARKGQPLGAEHFVEDPSSLHRQHHPVAWMDPDGVPIALGAAQATEGQSPMEHPPARFCVLRGFSEEVTGCP